MLSYSHTNIHDAVASLEPQMDYICKVSGAAGLSLSVVSGGKEAYAKHLGFRDVAGQIAPDGNTTYFIGSVTKGMVAVLVGILVEEGKLGWSTRVASILPEIQDSFQGRGSQITIADLLSHRTRPCVSYIIEFDCGENEEVQALLWKYDEEHPSPGVFVLEKGSRQV